MSGQEQSVAFIGLGAMGFPMASRLAGAGVHLTLFDSSPATRDRAGVLGEVASSVAAAVRSADVVITMLPADPQVLEVGTEIARHARAGQVLADFSTVHPRTTMALSEVAPPGLELVSASCMKAVAAAVTGDLTLFVGGSPDALDRVRALLGPMASLVIEVGDLSAPKALKIVNNMVVAGLNLAVAEAIVLAGGSGIDAGTLVAALADDGIGGWALSHQVQPYSVPRDFPTGLFGVRYMAKDIALASQLCDDQATSRFLCGPIAATFRGTQAIGYAEHYHPAILEWLDRSAGRPEGGDRPATDAPGTDDPAHDEVLAVLKASTRAMEQLVCVHGLALAATTGIPVDRAAAHLNSASAASATMAAFADGESVSPDSVVAGAATPVDTALGLAASLEVPAFALETAHDYVRGYARGREGAAAG